jgi:hypothetical protein
VAIQYETDEERRVHTSAIDTLADRYHVDASIVRDIYEGRLEELMDHARVRTYLSILVARYVTDLLDEMCRVPADRPLHDNCLLNVVGASSAATQSSR